MSNPSDRLRDWDLRVRSLAEQSDARIAEADALAGDLHRAVAGTPTSRSARF